MAGNFVVVFFAFRRHELLSQAVSSFDLASNSARWKKILVYQRGHEEMERLVLELKPSFDLIAETSGERKTVLANINFNRILGMRLAFEDFKADFVLGIEEDAVVSPDSLVFIETVFNQHHSKRNFMGINLGSIESRSNNDISGYSRLRYGLQGQAGGLTKSVWRRCKKLFQNFDDLNVGWDSRIEYYLKTGYMITPNVSRMCDFGWQDGSHATSNPDDFHFKSLRDNWISNTLTNELEYKEIPTQHSWRKDVVLFGFSSALNAKLRNVNLVRKCAVKFRKYLKS